MSTPSLAEFLDAAGIVIDQKALSNPDHPDYEYYNALEQRAIMALYGNVGANIDARDWGAIMATESPLEVAENALIDMYENKQYLVANAEYVLQQGYPPEAADTSYQQMVDRIGATYDPNWTDNTRFEGKLDTDGFQQTFAALQNNPEKQQNFVNKVVADAKADAPATLPPVPIIKPVVAAMSPPSSPSVWTSKKPFAGYAFNDLVNAARQRLSEGATAQALIAYSQQIGLTVAEATQVIDAAQQKTASKTGVPPTLLIAAAAALLFGG